MEFISTRGTAAPLGFEDVLLAGLARDGGLYVPARWPVLDAATLRSFRGMDYRQIAVAVMAPFVGDALTRDELAALVADAYAGFTHPAITPLTQLDSHLWQLDLARGPTLAFKDVALQLLGRLFDHVLARRGRRVTIVGATSGDTGSAAIEACRDRDAVDIFILHPKGRTSEVQRRQMTGVLAPNVHNIALEGTFDDCQAIVKALFNDAAFRDEMALSAVNSINWARIMAQIVYYVVAAVALGAPDREVAFAVPTGNFGNVYAAYAARQMGVPIARLVVGTNSNDILTRFFDSGVMSAAAVVPTISPSMDIQVSSNFERLLFDLTGRDGAAVASTLGEFTATGRFAVPSAQLDAARALFDAYRADEAQTSATMAGIWRATGVLIDPHTAVGVHAAQQARAAGAIAADVPLVALACAHPAKFPDAVAAATGVRPALPPHLADLYQREERVTVLPNDVAAVQRFVRRHSRVTTGVAHA